MKNFKKLSIITLLVAMAAIMFSCVDDDYDMPPVKQIPIGEIYTIQQIKDSLGTAANYQFKNEASVYATVTMDNETDNSYRTFYIQDSTAAIAVYQDVSGGVYIGDSVRIYLKDLVVMKYNKLFQINTISGGGINSDTSLVKQGFNNPRTPEIATIKQILNTIEYYQGRLVKIENTQFVDTDTAKTLYYAPDGTQAANKTLQDSLDNTIIVRTSSYSTFADYKIPNGSGSIIAIVSQYTDEMQLLIRRSSEVDMNEERLTITGGGGGNNGELLNETFETDLGAFSQYSVTGTQVWTRDTYGYAKMSGYDGSRFDNEDWLISPSLNFSGKTNVTLTFRHTAGYVYTGVWSDLQVLVSSDYTGSGDPNLASWTAYTFDTPPTTPYWTWVDSGDIVLSDFNGVNGVYIAFKYVSNTTDCSTWEIDNVIVTE